MKGLERHDWGYIFCMIIVIFAAIYDDHVRVSIWLAAATVIGSLGGKQA